MANEKVGNENLKLNEKLKSGEKGGRGKDTILQGIKVKEYFISGLSISGARGFCDSIICFSLCYPQFCGVSSVLTSLSLRFPFAV